MNVNFEMAIQYINLEAYDKAIEALQTAIREESDKNDERTAIEYTCVLGELLADLSRNQESEQEFLKVLEYCNRTNSLPKQRGIAKDFLDLFHGNVQFVTEAAEVPRNVKQVQDKSFIVKQQRKRGKK